MKKVFWTGILAGVLMIAVGILMNFVFEFVFPGISDIYVESPTFRANDDPLMTLFWVYPLFLGVALSFVWSKTKDLFGKGRPCKRALRFAGIYFLVFGIPTFLINYGSFSFPFQVVLSWTILNFLNAFIAGLVFAKILK